MSFTSVSGTRLLRALDKDVLLDQICICLLGQLFTLVGYLKLLRDDSEVLRAIHGGIGDLGLEGQVSHSSHIEVLHLEQIRDVLHAVLKSEHRICCHVTEASSQYGLILRQVRVELIPELKTLVDLDLSLNLRCN